MTATLCLLAALAFQSAQSDEEKAIQASKGFLKAMQESDFERTADLFHPKSLSKLRGRIIAGVEKAPAGVRDRFVRTLGYADWEELSKAAPRAFILAYLKNAKDLGEGARQVLGAMEGMEATVVGTVRKEDKIYIVVETTFAVAGETHVAPSLLVSYRDGDAWKLAFRGETNIGK